MTVSVTNHESGHGTDGLSESVIFRPNHTFHSFQNYLDYFRGWIWPETFPQAPTVNFQSNEIIHMRLRSMARGQEDSLHIAVHNECNEV